MTRAFEKKREWIIQEVREVFGLPWLTLHVDDERFDFMTFEKYWTLSLYLEERNELNYEQTYEDYYQP